MAARNRWSLFLEGVNDIPRTVVSSVRTGDLTSASTIGWGSIGFAGASTLAAFAPSAELLIAARVLLGIAAAMLMPSTLSIIRNIFADSKQRNQSGCSLGRRNSRWCGGSALIGSSRSFTHESTLDLPAEGPRNIDPLCEPPRIVDGEPLAVRLVEREGFSEHVSSVSVRHSSNSPHRKGARNSSGGTSAGSPDAPPSVFRLIFGTDSPPSVQVMTILPLLQPEVWLFKQFASAATAARSSKTLT